VPRVVSASAGLGSRDVSAADLLAVFDWIDNPALLAERSFAVLGIPHPLALPARPVEIRPRGAYSVRGHSLGGYGSVTINKLLASVVGELFGLYVQAYPRYGSEKRGLPTTYYLTIAEEPIRQHAELSQVELVPLYDVSSFGHGNPLAGLVDGGTLFLHSTHTDPELIWSSLPVGARTHILAHGIRLVALDTLALARRHAPSAELAVRMQGATLVGVFLRVAPFAAARGLSADELMAAVRGPLERALGKRGQRVVEANLRLIRAAYDELIDVTAAYSGEPQGSTPRRATSEVAA